VGPFRIGSRGSKLALWQAEHVAEQLRRRDPTCELQLVVIHTAADTRPDVPLAAIGDKGLWVEDIEKALLDGAIDLAVHSLKDVPSVMDERFHLSAVLAREDVRDVLLQRGVAELNAAEPPLERLPRGARVGTSSLRRSSQLLAVRPDLIFAPIRGNVDTRMKKLDSGEYDAVVLAAAGLKRLGADVRDGCYLDITVCLPAPGQGAICVESLAARADVRAFVTPLDDWQTRLAVESERTFAAALGAGCRVPLAAYAQAAGSPAEPWIALRTVVASEDGKTVIRADGEGSDPIALGSQVAEEALIRGAGRLLEVGR